MSIREESKNKNPVPSSRGYVRFEAYRCIDCGNQQRFPITQNLIHHVKCNNCGREDKITFILGSK